MEKLSKAASAHPNGFTQAAGNFMTNLEKIINPSDLWKPIFMGTSGFQKLFCDRTSELSESCKAIRISLRTPAACRKLA
jgi:hypothetical protein